MVNCTVPGAIAAISIATHGGFFRSSTQSAYCVFACSNSGYLPFSYNQKPSLSWSAMHSPHPRHKGYHRKRENCTDLLYNRENFFTAYCIFLPSAACYWPTSTRIWKTFLPKYRAWQDSNQRREQQDWDQQEQWSHWYVNSLTGLMVNYLLWSLIPPLWRKELPPQFLSLTSRNCRKTSNQIMYFCHIEAAMSYCILYRL
jgi:hypothetical protein